MTMTHTSCVPTAGADGPLSSLSSMTFHRPLRGPFASTVSGRGDPSPGHPSGTGQQSKGGPPPVLPTSLPSSDSSSPALFLPLYAEDYYLRLKSQ